MNALLLIIQKHTRNIETVIGGPPPSESRPRREKWWTASSPLGPSSCPRTLPGTRRATESTQSQEQRIPYPAASPWRFCGPRKSGESPARRCPSFSSNTPPSPRRRPYIYYCSPSQLSPFLFCRVSNKMWEVCGGWVHKIVNGGNMGKYETYGAISFGIITEYGKKKYKKFTSASCLTVVLTW